MSNRHPMLLPLGIALLLAPLFVCTPLWGASEIPVQAARADTGSSIDNTVPQAPAVPRAVVTEMEYDAGTVKQGEMIEHTFIIKNTGQASLHILKAKPS